MNQRWIAEKKLASLILACLSITSCSSQKEVRISSATPGDVLTIVDDKKVVLVSAFKPGQPNGLFDGGIKVISDQGQPRFAEINVVCSMPDLPNWPQYDNIYGRWLKKGEQPGIKGGETHWQLLSYFNGDKKSTGKQEVPLWAYRLSQNLCRKGDFSDKQATTV